MQEAVPDSLDLFAKRKVILTIGGQQVENVPTKTVIPADITSLRSLEFTAGADQVKYTDLKNSFLALTFQYTKPDGTALGEDTKIITGFVQNILGSMFKSVDVYFNDSRVTPIDDNYAYVAWFYNFFRGGDAKLCPLSQSLWREDDYSSLTIADQQDPTAAAASNNSGLKRRAQIFEKGNIVTVISPIFVAPHLTNKLYPDNVKFDWRFELNPYQFWLMAKTANDPWNDSKIKLLSAEIQLKRVQVSTQVALAHKHILQNENALFDMKHSLTREFFIPLGNAEFRFPNVYVGNKMPTACFCFFLKPQQKKGDLARNPFVFRDPGLQDIKIQMGTKEFPAIDMNLDASKKNTQKAFHETLKALDLIGTGEGVPQFNVDSFNSGLAIYGIDLTRDGNNSTLYDNSQFESNDLTVRGKFREPLAEPFVRKFPSLFYFSIYTPYTHLFF